MARYVVTGGTGFIGSALVQAIVDAGDEAIIASRGKHFLRNSDHWIDYDLKDRATIANLLESQPAGIYHLAWSSTPGSAEMDPESDIITNLGGTVSLFRELARALSIPILFVSSGGTVYGNVSVASIPEQHELCPISAYGITKTAAEAYANSFRRSNGLDVRIARVSNPYGSCQSSAKYQGAATIFCRKIIHGDTIELWGNGQAVRDYIHISDTVRGLIALMSAEPSDLANPMIYNIGSGSGTSLNTLINTISRITNIKPKIEYRPSRKFDVDYNVLDISKAKRDLLWSPHYNIETGLYETVASLDIK